MANGNNAALASAISSAGLFIAAAIVIGSCTGRAADNRADAPATVSSAANDLIGRRVVVDVRPDALGMAGPLPVSVGTSGINGAMISFDGELRVIEPNWVCVRRSIAAAGITEDVWLPMHAVLSIRDRVSVAVNAPGR
ncbi:MAG: hypothetical protein AAGD00_08300 [Planctomycetota bacterium]